MNIDKGNNNSHGGRGGHYYSTCLIHDVIIAVTCVVHMHSGA